MPNYIKRVLGKAAGIASALTLGVLSYTARPAKAAEAPKKVEDPNLVRIVADSYAQAENGQEKDQAIMKLAVSACQDPGISTENASYILSSLSKQISNPEKKKELTTLAEYYTETQEKAVHAKSKYALALNNAAKKTGEERTKAEITAGREYFEALKTLEESFQKTQYADEMLEVAKHGLKLAKKVPETLDVEPFKKYVAESEKAAEQAKKEEQLLSQILTYDSAIETALANAEKERTTAGKINWYSQAREALQQAEEIFPYDQFSSNIAELEKVITGLEQEQNTEEQPKPEEKAEQNTGEKEKTPAAEAEPKDEKKAPEIPAPKDKAKAPKKATGKGDVSPDKKGTSIADIFADILGERYNTRMEYRQGILFEDKEGHKESLYGKLGDVLELALLNEEIHGTNPAGNKTSDINISHFIEAKPLFILTPLSPAFKDLLQAGTSVENLQNKEWVYNETQTNDTPTETETKYSNIRNFITKNFFSAWISSHIRNLAKLRLAGVQESVELRTEENSRTHHENHTDPSASYSETSQVNNRRDIYKKKGISALAAIPLEFLTEDAVKGLIGVSWDHIQQEYKMLNNGGEWVKKTHTINKPGIRAELYVNNDFGLAITFLQDLEKDKEAGEDTAKAKTYRGQIAAALNLGTVKDERETALFNALIFGHGWIQGYQDDVKYGAGMGGVFGSDVIKDISGLVQLLHDKDSRKTGSRIELSDEMQSFLERKGFNNIPVGAIGGKNKYGFALIAYGGIGRAQGIDRKTKTEKFAELSAVLDTPKTALILSGYYADMALEQQWGMRFRADIKRGLLTGFAAAVEYNQNRFLATHELERELALALEIPLGVEEKDE